MNKTINVSVINGQLLKRRNNWNFRYFMSFDILLNYSSINVALNKKSG